MDTLGINFTLLYFSASYFPLPNSPNIYKLYFTFLE